MTNPTIICNGKTVELLREIIPEPTACPFCGGAVSRKVNSGGDVGAITMCTDLDCPAKCTGKIKKWIKALDILGVGDSVLEALENQLNVTNPAGLYTLDSGALANMTIGDGIRFGETRADSLIAEINKKKCLPLHKFLGSLGVPYLGRRRAQIMMESAAGELDTLEDWRNGKLLNPEIAARAGVPGVSEAIHEGINKASGVIDALLNAGVTIAQPESDIVITSFQMEGPAKLDGKTFVFTGAILRCDENGKRFTRDMMHNVVRQNGGSITDRVAKGVILVQADVNSTSSKSKKAQTVGATIMSEADFWNMVGDAE